MLGWLKGSGGMFLLFILFLVFLTVVGQVRLKQEYERGTLAGYDRATAELINKKAELREELAALRYELKLCQNSK